MAGKRPIAWMIIVAGVAVALTGCGKTHAPAAPDKAEAALQTALDAWVRGESARKLSSDQGLQIVDPDWNAGWKLMSFLTADTVQAEGNPDDPVRCRVSLSLKNPQGEKVDKEVTYVVQLGNPVVISRVGR